MIQWNFNEAEANVKSFTVIPEGKHLARINAVEERTSAKGYPQLKIELAISGYSSHVWDYITFNPDQSKMVNQKLGSIYNGFGIPKTLNTQTWLGKVGGVCIKHETYEGEKQAKVRYYCEKPAGATWIEGNAGATGASDAEPMNISADDLPF